MKRGKGTTKKRVKPITSIAGLGPNRRRTIRKGGRARAVRGPSALDRAAKLTPPPSAAQRAAALEDRVEFLERELAAARTRTPLPLLLPTIWSPAVGPAKAVEELDDAHVANILRLAVRRAPSGRALELLAVAYEAGKRGLVKGPIRVAPPPAAPDPGFTPGLPHSFGRDCAAADAVDDRNYEDYDNEFWGVG